ncbi:hypothetical protein H5410_041166 [Solanum commersonii]|uniref:Movement protein n=1 Tax=Solanum commersonii TaxID=4109 RepID=A0A9J5XTQ6_SOLCO|nr:hypothetical protein H5410_041166 [Solanum commersonii]
MNKEIQKEEENSVQILETEEDQRGYAVKATFDGELFKKIQGLQLKLKTKDNIFSRMQRMFARNKISYHEYQEVEKVIEITQTTERHKLNLLTKPMIEQILRKIPERKRKKMNYVHLGGIQILVKSTFKEGINCPIVVNLSDERFINARKGNLGIVEGNLAYTKLLFTYYPKYSISLKDADFNDALSLHFQVKRNDLFKPGNHIMSIYYQALYTVTNSNYANVYKNNEMIEIDQECAGIARIIEAEIQHAQISEEYEIRFGKTQEIGSSNKNPGLSIENGRNFIKKDLVK